MTGQRASGPLLGEYIEVTGYERKYAFKVLGRVRHKSPGKGQRGKKAKFKPSAGRGLKELWLAMDQSCGKRMRDIIPLWPDHFKAIHTSTRKALLEMSPATIDRRLAPHKINGSKKRLPPKSENAIKAIVEIRAES